MIINNAITLTYTICPWNPKKIYPSEHGRGHITLLLDKWFFVSWRIGKLRANYPTKKETVLIKSAATPEQIGEITYWITENFEPKIAEEMAGIFSEGKKEAKFKRKPYYIMINNKATGEKSLELVRGATYPKYGIGIRKIGERYVMDDLATGLYLRTGFSNFEDAVEKLPEAAEWRDINKELYANRRRRNEFNELLERLKNAI